MKRIWMLTALLCVGALLLCACADSSAAEKRPAPTGVHLRADVDWPKEKLDTNEDGVPILNVYVVKDDKTERVDVETYVQGVLAGEMKNDWPLEALKAQAVLARTFVMKFVQDKDSRYPNADISTDIEEAQAYDASAVNARIKQAVQETRGQVLVSDGQLTYAWFHAHSGGVTERARAGLGWAKEEPPYTNVAQGTEPDAVQDEKDMTALKQAQAWEAAFTYEEFEAACRKQGVKVKLADGMTLTVTERGESGRAVTIDVDGQPVNAAELRIALGSTKMRSTLLTSLQADGGEVKLAGKGYGHGVGMSQWGAYGMAQQGGSAEQIIMHYFRQAQIVRLW